MKTKTHILLYAKSALLTVPVLMTPPLFVLAAAFVGGSEPFEPAQWPAYLDNLVPAASGILPFALLHIMLAAVFKLRRNRKSMLLSAAAAAGAVWAVSILGALNGAENIAWPQVAGLSVLYAAAAALFFPLPPDRPSEKSETRLSDGL